MTSPLESKLQTRLQKQLSAEERGECLAELACYYARVGEFEDAERLRKSLRSEFADARSPSVSIFIMALEALLLYFRELSPLARDRMLRANLLSKSFEEWRLYALTCAWLAHIDFNQGRYDSMASYIDRVLAQPKLDDGSAFCRVSVVLGDAFAFCRKQEASRFWYERARQSSLELGDQATIGALIYNRAALHVAHLRLNCVCGSNAPGEIALARAEVQSAINYQQIAGLKSLGHLLTSASIGSAILEARHSDALKLLSNTFLENEVPEASAEIALHRADLAMCLAEVGRIEEARELATQIRSMQIEEIGLDDQALALSSLARAFEIVGNRSESETLHLLAKARLSEHSLMIKAIEDLLEVHIPKELQAPKN